MGKEYVKARNGYILGWIITEPNGDKKACMFNGEIVAKYKKSLNITTSFTGAILSRSDTCSAVIWQKEIERNGMKNLN